MASISRSSLVVFSASQHALPIMFPPLFRSRRLLLPYPLTLSALKNKQQQQQQQLEEILIKRCICCSSASPDKAKGGLPRFFVEKLPSMQGTLIPIQGDEFCHMSKVLRLNVNDKLELFDGKGGIVEAIIARVGRTTIDVETTRDTCYLSPVGPFWHVAAAFGSLKGGRADWLVEKCTELGAKSVIPLLSERSPVASEGRSNRWTRMVVAATKQCQRLHSMDLKSPTHLNALLKESSSFEIIMMADAYATPLVKAFPRIKKNWNGLLFIGPEGDFTDNEKQALAEAGALPVGLGPRRLRVETAAIAMLSTVSLLGDSQCFESSTT